MEFNGRCQCCDSLDNVSTRTQICKDCYVDPDNNFCTECKRKLIVNYRAICGKCFVKEYAPIV